MFDALFLRTVLYKPWSFLNDSGVFGIAVILPKHVKWYSFFWAMSKNCLLTTWVQASFTALNIEPDDQIDDEVDNTKEIQVCWTLPSDAVI